MDYVVKTAACEPMNYWDAVSEDGLLSFDSNFVYMLGKFNAIRESYSQDLEFFYPNYSCDRGGQIAVDGYEVSYN